MKKLTILTLLTILVGVFILISGIAYFGYNSITSGAVGIDQIKEINGVKYHFAADRISMLREDNNSKTTYGILADTHGQIDKISSLMAGFKQIKVDGILVAGDLVNNEHFSKRGILWKDQDEMAAVLEVLGKSGLPVFIITGNHDRLADYDSAWSKLSLSYPNLIDMNQYRVFDGDDIEIISLPGYTDQKFTAPGAFYIDQEYVSETGKYATGLEDPIVLLAHGPAYTTGSLSNGPGTIYGGSDIGDRATAEMMKHAGLSYGIMGHVHEAGGLAATLSGVKVEPNTWAEEFVVNVGGLEAWTLLDGTKHNGMAGILTIDGELAKYNPIYYQE